MPRLPYRSVEAVQNALEMMVDQFPQASSIDRKKSSMRHSLSKSKRAAVEKWAQHIRSAPTKEPRTAEFVVSRRNLVWRWMATV